MSRIDIAFSGFKNKHPEINTNTGTHHVIEEWTQFKKSHKFESTFIVLSVVAQRWITITAIIAKVRRISNSVRRLFWGLVEFIDNLSLPVNVHPLSVPTQAAKYTLNNNRNAVT